MCLIKMCDVKQVSETKMPFSRDITMRLIQEYEKYPELYNVQDPLYKNKTKRQECLNKIAISLGCYGHITIGDVKKKINGLRTQYFNEMAKRKKSQTSGTATSDIYTSHWWCFEMLHFLENSAPVRKGESNLDLESVSQQYSVLTGYRAAKKKKFFFDCFDCFTLSFYKTVLKLK
ncbi:hypothetical protein ABEB36_015632 [Hypothenemus hampei]|uniref:MADF domain-containing protein n=1 Tax=Hypothenemus hampei TaxID=57062 RepID=A0ABD1DZH8_HYPHA